MTGWIIIVNYMLPIAFFTLLLFSIPLPNFIGRFRNKLLKGIGNIRLPYTEINIITFLATLSILLFIGAGLTVWKHSKDISNERNNLLLNNARAVRWRAERNFWISACNLAMYW